MRVRLLASNPGPEGPFATWGWLCVGLGPLAACGWLVVRGACCVLCDWCVRVCVCGVYVRVQDNERALNLCHLPAVLVVVHAKKCWVQQREGGGAAWVWTGAPVVVCACVCLFFCSFCVYMCAFTCAPSTCTQHVYAQTHTNKPTCTRAETGRLAGCCPFRMTGGAWGTV